MKKLVSVLLILCMLLAVPAMAANKIEGVTMYPQTGLDFTRMEDRHMLTDDALRNRMQWAYTEIHETGHFEELAVLGHENGIGQEVNRVLNDMNVGLTVYDYMIYDSFELQLQDQYANQIGNGNTLEVNFDLNLDRDVHLVVALSNDQATWKCVEAKDVTQYNDGTASVRFSELGTVLFMIEVQHQPAGPAVEPDSNFTPSVTGKPAPDVIPPHGSASNIIARIYNEEDQLISEVPDEGWLVITPVSRREQAEDKQVRERLEWAYNQIKTTPDVGDLPARGHQEGVGKDIDQLLKNEGFDLTSEDLVVRDLFDASLYGTEYVDALNDEGHYIEITFDLDVDPDDPLVILVTNDNKTWFMLTPDDYIIHADGSVTMFLEELGTIAILVDSGKQTSTGTSVKAPKTGE